MFYALRVLLGVAEAGFFPGMLLYFTAWFPAAERARAISRFMTAIPVASIVGGPISGALLGLSGMGGIAGWRWLFLLEWLPAVALGFVTLAYLDDRPAEARWLTAGERNEIARALESEAAGVEHPATLSQALKKANVWNLACLWFLVLVPAYGVSLWLPQIVRDLFRQGDLVVGFLVAIPQVAGIVATIAVGASSDRTGERYLHVAIPLLAGSVALCLRSAGAAATEAVAATGERQVELVFDVPDIHAAYQALKARGVVFRVEPRLVTGDRWATDFRDPDGYLLSIFGPAAEEDQA
jgi:MFS family permease